MGPFIVALQVLLVATSIILVILILLHRSRGGGMSDMFGGGFSSSMGGSRVVEKNLDRITIIVGVLWFVSIFSLSLMFSIQ